MLNNERALLDTFMNNLEEVILNEAKAIGESHLSVGFRIGYLKGLAAGHTAATMVYERMTHEAHSHSGN